MKNFNKLIVSKIPYIAKIYRWMFNAKAKKQTTRKNAGAERLKRNQPYTFKGWGMMTTTTNPPWVNSFEDCPLDVVRGFECANNNLIELVKSEEFILSQYMGKDVLGKVNELKWRHYIIYWSALFAARNTSTQLKSFVECGVCDGLGIYYAMSALESKNFKFHSYLYDAWEEMKEDYLLADEKSNIGKYAYLQIDNAIRNLKAFSENATFNKGYIPKSFETSINPTEISWLHIDINSALPTEDCLKFLYDKVLPGGIILFDDYGFRRYSDTKKAVDTFFHTRNDQLLHMPTGQAIVFKG